MFVSYRILVLRKRLSLHIKLARPGRLVDAVANAQNENRYQKNGHLLTNGKTKWYNPNLISCFYTF